MDSDETVVTPSEIRRRYSDGERDFRGLEIEDKADDAASFRDAVLDGVDFSQSFIVADFSNASLRGCRFVKGNVKTCVFDRADLHGCDFSETAIDAATFRSAKLEASTFAGATIYGYTLKASEKPDW
jgi:uncharacterized protein YjbI with pentapeptide repeats